MSISISISSEKKIGVFNFDIHYIVNIATNSKEPHSISMRSQFRTISSLSISNWDTGLHMCKKVPISNEEMLLLLLTFSKYSKYVSVYIDFQIGEL